MQFEEDGATDIKRACRDDDADAVAGLDSAAVLKAGGALMEVACRRRAVGAVKALLDHGVSVDVDTGGGWTPLLRACHETTSRGLRAVVRVLLEAKADANPMTGVGETAVWKCAFAGHADIIEDLAAAGADLGRAKPSTGNSPIFMAAQNGMIDAVGTLARLGANVDQASSDGSTPLFIASLKGYDSVVQILLAAGASVDQARNTDGATPLFMASQKGQDSVVQILLAAGASVDQADNTGCTPLFMASQNGQDSVIASLLSAGADVNAADNRQLTPVNIAAYQGHLSAVKLLVGAKADPTVKDKWGCDALKRASDQKHTDVVAWLSSRSA